MKPPLTLAHTLWASTILVGALSIWLGVTAEHPHMTLAAAIVLFVAVLAAIPEPKETT